MDKGNPPKCKICNNLVTWTYKTKSWKTYCSRECFMMDKDEVSEKRKLTLKKRYGVSHNWNNGVLREKQKQTMRERYGVEYALQSLHCLNKMKQTNLEKYGVEHSLQHTDILNKWISTNLEKYGVKVSSMLAETKEKQKQTNIERYGVKVSSMLAETKEKQKQTNIERHGRRYKILSHMVDILPLLENYNWLFEQYIVQNKTSIQIADELNINYNTVCNYLRKSEILIKQSYKTSYKSILWLEQIEKEQQIQLIREYLIPGTRYRADGYCVETNTIYEFYGDYWHGNPNVYNSDIVNESTNYSMGELYQKTIERENLIKSMGYNLIVIWESDYIA